MAAESFVGRVHVEVVRDLSPVGVNDSMAVAFTHSAVRVNAVVGQFEGSARTSIAWLLLAKAR